MAFEINDTIVVCAARQLREAAVVLSCFASDRFTPLIILEPPPVTEEQYRKLYEDYRVVRANRDSVSGGQLGRMGVLAGKFAGSDDVDLKAELLTPYRSWWRHNQIIADILSRLSLRRAIFLFEPQSQEISSINPIPNRQLTEERHQFIAETLERTYILPLSDANTVDGNPRRHVYQSLSDLTDVAYRVIRGSPLESDAIEIPETDTIRYFAGLQRALQLGVPLRPVRGNSPSTVEAMCGEANNTLASPSEAVLIEVSDNTTNLLGVLYAHQQQAKLVLYPEPDISFIRQAQSEIDDKQKEATKSLSYLAAHHEQGLALPDLTPDERFQLQSLKGVERAKRSESALCSFERTEFLGALHDSFADPVNVAIRQLHEAVSAVVPDAVVSEIGSLNLTVFTAGMPYNFVRKSSADWSKKPIGHVAGDASLLVMTELCRVHRDDDVGFNLIFDPGYFETTGETTAVLHELEKRVSIPLVLRKEAGSHVALSFLSQTLPLDVVFFNTHGSDNAIQLSDMVLPAYKLAQRVQFNSQPIIFNNSCLSWIGVGRQFIRTGARAYIGTLWSVDAELAAKYAQTVFNRMIHDDLPVSQAMRQTGTESATENAYIFVGTCNSRLDRSLVANESTEARRASSAAVQLLLSLSKLFQQTQGYSSYPLLTTLEDLLFNRAEELITFLQQHSPAPDLVRLEVLLLYLSALANLIQRRRSHVEEKIGVIDETRRLIDALTLEHKRRFSLLARYLHLSGRIYFRLGQTERAVKFLNESVNAAEQANDPAEGQLLELSDAYKKLGDVTKAFEAAVKAKKASESGPDNPSLKRGQLGALGRLASICNWLNQRDRALVYAKEGFDLAAKLDDPGEQAEFKADEARAYLGLPNYDAALEAAKDAIKFARLALHDERELSAVGIVTQALIGKGELDTALRYANTGLQQARNRGFLSATGDFLCDIAKIKSLSNEPASALKSFLEAVAIYVSTGEIAKVRNGLDAAKSLRNEIKTSEAILEMAALEFFIIDALDFSMRRALTTDLVQSLKEAISKTGFAALRQRLLRLVEDAGRVVLKRKTEPSDQLLFIVKFLTILEDWAAGRKIEALEAAKNLDQISAGGFQLVAFLEGPSMMA